MPRYAAHLARALDEVAPEFPGLALTLLTTSAGAEVAAPRNLPVAMRELPRGTPATGPARILLEQVTAARARGDLLHFFDLTGPLLRPGRPYVATFHDASVVYGWQKARHGYKRRLHPWALRRALRVVAISAFAKEEAVRHFGASPERITVLHSGPGLVERSPEGAADTLPAGPFLLYVGDLTAKKNVAGLVSAHTRAGVPDGLVLVGRRRHPYPELDAALADAGGQVTVLEDGSDATVDGLLRAATALALPSRYEGFGFTPLEAMARGCPVLASDIPAVREVSGAGALLLPVDDEVAWADAIRRVAGDARVRADLRARGAETVARYSWQETARELCGLFTALTPDVRGAR